MVSGKIEGCVCIEFVTGSSRLRLSLKSIVLNVGRTQLSFCKTFTAYVVHFNSILNAETNSRLGARVV